MVSRSLVQSSLGSNNIHSLLHHLLNSCLVLVFVDWNYTTASYSVVVVGGAADDTIMAVLVVR